MGCPSLQHKDAIYVVRNDRYIIEYWVSPYKSFEEGELKEVYDKQNDKWELNNISDSVSTDCINDLLKFAENRHNKLRDYYMNWLNTNMSIKE